MSTATCAEASLEILDVAFPEGFGVARMEGFVCFIPGGLPGDVVRVKIARENKRFKFAHLIAIEKNSPFRVAPFCPHAGTCGGCVLQGLLYRKQLEVKENYLFQTLRRIGGLRLETCEARAIVPSVDEYYYRSKVELFFGGKSDVTLGFRERVSPFEPYRGKLVPIQQCPIFSRSLEHLLPVFSEYAARVNACAPGRGQLRPVFKKLIVRESKWNGRLQVNLVISGGNVTDLRWLEHEVEKAVPEIASLWVTTDRGKEVLSGTAYVEEKLGERIFRVYPHTFFQPNSKTAERLYASIARLCSARRNERILGLYCGTGPLEISLSSFARAVAGIDSDAENIRAAIENCRINRVRNCQFYRQSVEKASAMGLPGPFDLIVVDPPRTGLSPEAFTFIRARGAPRVVYVSCNPSTLARDLKRMSEAGYIPAKIEPFDFFPHAAHLETLVLLEKDR